MSLLKSIFGINDSAVATDAATKAYVDQTVNNINSGLTKVLYPNMQHVSDSSQVPPGSIETSRYTTSAGSTGGGSQTTTVWTASDGSIYICSKVSGLPITREELDKLATLKEQRVADTKKFKLEHFKKLPANFRQHVINDFLWEKEIENINNVAAIQTEEEKVLESKKGLWGTGGVVFPPQFGGIGNILTGIDYSVGIRTAPKLPIDITVEELIKAHNEATVEESFTNTESK